MLRRILSKSFLLFFLFTLFFYSTTKVSAITLEECKRLPLPGVNLECRTLMDREISNQGKTAEEIKKDDTRVDKGKECRLRGKIIDSKGDCTDRPTGTGCDTISISLAGCLTFLADSIFGWLMGKINTGLSYLLTGASAFLDYIVYMTIVKFKTNFVDLKLNIDSPYGSVGIGDPILGNGDGLIYYLWGVIRDFLNIAILVIIIYHAVFSMFEGFESTRKKFIGLLVFSIVVNFSLLFVKVAIDISNILSLQAYTLAIKPKGTKDINEFRTPAFTGAPMSYGNYLMDAIGSGDLRKNETTKGVPGEKNTLEGTFAFELGRAIILIGMIYLMCYMSWMLLLRGLFLLLAMVISPLIALDMFFRLFLKDGPSKDLADQVRKLTGKLEGDFMEALVKVPVMLLFIFLIGVLASSIISGETAVSIIKGTSEMKDTSRFPPNFLMSMIVLFKFAVLFGLTKVLFDKLNSIQFGAEGTHFKKWTSAATNYMLGKKIAGTANLISRAGTFGLGTVAGRALSGLGSTIDRKSQFKWLSSVGKNMNKAGTKLQTYTYDPRNSKTLGKAAQYAAKIPGQMFDVSKLNAGKAVEAGSKKIADDKLKAKNDARAAKLEKEAEYEHLTNAEYEKVKDKSKVDFDGGKATADQIAKAISEINEKGRTTLNGKTYNRSSEMFMPDKKTGYSKAEDTQVTAIKSLADAKKKALDEKRALAVKNAQIENARKNTNPLFNSEATIAQRKADREATVVDAQKSAKEKEAKKKEQLRIIENDIPSARNEINAFINKISGHPIFSGYTVNADSKKVIDDYLINLGEAKDKTLLPNGDPNQDKEALNKFVKEFNEDGGKEELFKAKEKIVSDLQAHIIKQANSAATSAIRSGVNLTEVQVRDIAKNKKQLNELATKIGKNKDNYSNTITPKKDDKKTETKPVAKP